MPKMKKHHHAEELMYPAVKQYFLKQQSCTKAVADLPDGDSKIHLSHNLHKRDIDVVGIEESDSRYTVHIAEGKLFANGHAFEQCIHQLASVRDYADYLWAFVPKSQWMSLTEKDRKKNLKLVKDQGMGLLWVDVDANKCEAVRDADRNKEVDEDDRKTLLEEIGLGKALRFPSIPTLGTDAAINAAKTMALMCMVEYVYKEIMGPKKSFNLSWYFDDISEAATYARDEHWFITGDYAKDGPLGVELDPFGCYLDDGVPVAWICMEVSKDKMLAEAKTSTALWSHWYWDVENAFDVVPVGDVEAVASMRKDSTNFYLLRRIELMGRNVQDVKKEMTQILKRHPSKQKGL